MNCTFEFTVLEIEPETFTRKMSVTRRELNWSINA